MEIKQVLLYIVLFHLVLWYAFHTIGFLILASKLEEVREEAKYQTLIIMALIALICTLS